MDSFRATQVLSSLPLAAIVCFTELERSRGGGSWLERLWGGGLIRPPTKLILTLRWVVVSTATRLSLAALSLRGPQQPRLLLLCSHGQKNPPSSRTFPARPGAAAPTEFKAFLQPFAPSPFHSVGSFVWILVEGAWDWRDQPREELTQREACSPCECRCLFYPVDCILVCSFSFSSGSAQISLSSEQLASRLAS